MGLNESIIEMRVMLQSAGLKKSGMNKFAGFKYFELGDFLPTINLLMNQARVNDVFAITEDQATLTLIKGDEREIYTLPYIHFPTPTNKQGVPSMQDVQYLGAIITYYKRYLYMNAFGITDGEVVDAMQMPEMKIYLTWSKATPTDKDNYKREFWEVCKSHNVEVTEFIDFLGMSDAPENEKHNLVVQYLRSEELFEDQMESYKLFKIKQDD